MSLQNKNDSSLLLEFMYSTTTVQVVPFCIEHNEIERLSRIYCFDSISFLRFGIYFNIVEM